MNQAILQIDKLFTELLETVEQEKLEEIWHWLNKWVRKVKPNINYYER